MSAVSVNKLLVFLVTDAGKFGIPGAYQITVPFCRNLRTLMKLDPAGLQSFVILRYVLRHQLTYIRETFQRKPGNIYLTSRNRNIIPFWFVPWNVMECSTYMIIYILCAFRKTFILDNAVSFTITYIYLYVSFMNICMYIHWGESRLFGYFLLQEEMGSSGSRRKVLC